MSFSDWIRETALDRGSNIIFSLDLTCYPPRNSIKRFYRKVCILLKKVLPNICAVKIGWPAMIPLTFYGKGKLVIEMIHEHDTPVIFDAKITDVKHTNERIVEHLLNAGVDAITAMPTIGIEDALDVVSEKLKERGKGLIIVSHMSHKGAHLVFSSLFKDFLEIAAKLNADGVIVGATYPEKIKEARRLLPDNVKIYAVGIGAQGGSIEQAMANGADYLIIGRTIYESEYPDRTSLKLRNIVASFVKKLS